jgi:F0F1-type ATP synthase membrane subunit b/b'
MQAITDTLGLNLRDIAWHLVNYAVLLLCLWWVGFRPIMRKLAERERRVREQMALAELVQTEAAQIEVTRQEMLAAARTEADAILAQARVEAQRLIGAAQATNGNGGASSARSGVDG